VPTGFNPSLLEADQTEALTELEPKEYKPGINTVDTAWYCVCNILESSVLVNCVLSLTTDYYSALAGKGHTTQPSTQLAWLVTTIIARVVLQRTHNGKAIVVRL
jgi:hypothetical protein